MEIEAGKRVLAEETIASRLSSQRHHEDDTFELLAWVFMRLSGAALLGMALFHLLYIHFVIPGGVGGISYATIAARWSDPVWGFAWRLFDLLLLVLGLTHGTNGVRAMLGEYLPSRFWQGLLLVIYAGLLGVGAYVIVTFRMVE